MGFSELKDCADGISSKMLSESLDSLEDDGLVTREVVSEQRFRVEYSLTGAGESLGQLVANLVQWGSDNAAVLADEDASSAPEGSTRTTVTQGPPRRDSDD